MQPSIRNLIGASLIGLASSASLAAQAQPADIYWSDDWNFVFHRLSDLDGDGSFLGTGEVMQNIANGEFGTTRPRDLRVTMENGTLVNYWLHTTGRTIARGEDLDGNGILQGEEEVKRFRDSGHLDGASIPTALDIADDGAVWWTSTGLLSQTVNGLLRLEDLNGDKDAADPGEQVVMVDGNLPHPFEHDLGTSTMLGWSIRHIAAVGNGMMAYDGTDHAVYLFEDLNQDGDVLDPGESILLLNASGERPDIPINPDFADGTLKNLQTPAGYPTQLNYLASAMENGVRTFYFGTTASPFNPSSGLNHLGQGLNFIIFKGVDGNGDGDINDAGEVGVFFDGSSTDGDPELLIMRGMDVLDGGTVYAMEIKPFPALFAGPDGNAWIHRFEDLNGDGDAADPGETQFELFDLIAHGPGPQFPVPTVFGNLMADAWDFSVHRITQFTDMGGGAPGSNGTPSLTGTGSLILGTPVSIDLENAPPFAQLFLALSGNATPTVFVGGTLFTVPADQYLTRRANAMGKRSISATWSGGLPPGFDVWLQYIVVDPGVPDGTTISNSIKLTTR